MCSSSLPEVCPICQGVGIDACGSCVACGIARADAVLWRRESDAWVARASDLARVGRLAEARALLQDPWLLPSEDAVRLDALCAAASGAWNEVSLSAAPERWLEALGPGVPGLWRRARAAARRRDWESALTLAQQCCGRAPFLVPAWKLHVLALAGCGQNAVAESLRQRLLAALPEEPDLLRWCFAPSPPAEAARRSMVRTLHRLARRRSDPRESRLLRAAAARLAADTDHPPVARLSCR
jgi:hypothetical protein